MKQVPGSWIIILQDLSFAFLSTVLLFRVSVVSDVVKLLFLQVSFITVQIAGPTPGNNPTVTIVSMQRCYRIDVRWCWSRSELD